MFGNALTARRALLSCAALAVFTFAGMARPANAQNLLTNGSFEQGNFVNNGNGAESLAVGATAITGWTVINNELAWDQVGNPYGHPVSDGSFALDLTGYHDSRPYGGVQQILTTTVGQQYALAFDLGVEQSDSRYAGPNGITASAGGVSQTFTYNPPITGSSYGRFTLNFTAVSASTTISLIGSQAGGGQYIGLDNASVVAVPAAVPEPGSVALLIGMTVTGAGFLSRRKRASANV